MATWGDIKTLVTKNLGKSGDADVVTLMPIWADSFQRKVQRDRNYWFLKTVAERTINSASQTYPLPANFRDDMVFYLKQLISGGDPSNTFIELDAITDIDVVRSYEPVDVNAPNGGAGQKAQPEAYVVGADTMSIWPWPDKVYTLGCQYWKDVDPPTASSPNNFTNKWITDYMDLYEEELTYLGFRYLQEWDDAAKWKAMAKITLGDIRAAHVARALPSKITLVPKRDQYGTTRDSQNATWKVYN